jgi:hypothetical protein
MAYRQRGYPDPIANSSGNSTQKLRRIGNEGIAGTYDFTSHASWNQVPHTRLSTWSCSPKLMVAFGQGSGQQSSPFSITSQEFQTLCRNEFGFSQPFLQKLVAKVSLFEHHFDFSESSEISAPMHLEIAMSNFENASFFCLLRYDITARTAKCMLFVKPMDNLRRRPLLPNEIAGWFDKNQATLTRHPLLILNVILGLIQFRAQDYVQWRLDLNNMESRLGVTRDGQLLKMSGYEDVCWKFGILNADLAGLAKKIADTELSAATILEHARSLQRLIQVCEAYEALNTSFQSHPVRNITSEQREEVQATITRSELYLRNMKMSQDVLQSLTAVLYNRINKQDADSMKTIAVVTLVFLPATFVSAVFSTGIFNFHASEPPDQPRTVSKYGWVYLLACLLSTAVTLLSWVCWYSWGRMCLDKLKLSGKRSSGEKIAPIATTIYTECGRHGDRYVSTGFMKRLGIRS